MYHTIIGDARLWQCQCVVVDDNRSKLTQFNHILRWVM